DFVAQDVNRDGWVRFNDLLMLVDHLSQDVTGYAAANSYDINRDGRVSVSDLLSMVDYLKADQVAAVSSGGEGESSGLTESVPPARNRAARPLVADEAIGVTRSTGSSWSDSIDEAMSADADWWNEVLGEEDDLLT
ncbi:MAG: dockerin type I domain-containing protein, partial [Pirellulaceae bacterium]|nr:dockerin type I domain-containing protein [Pirellulaceae bacterium]